MKVKKESISLVIVGNWNIHILTPDWVAKNIFHEEKLKIDVALNIGLPNRYTSETKKVMLIPTENNVTLRALDTSGDCLNSMEEIASNLISKLPVTPIRAFGTNFGYIEDNNPDLLYIFDLPDKDNLLKARFKDEHCFIQRSFKLNENILNIKISRIPNGADFDFNFHYDVSNAPEANEKIKGSVNANKRFAESFLKEVYGLKLV